MSESNITTISIPKVLADKLKKRIEGTGFNSISSYVVYILRQIVSNIEENEKKDDREAFSKGDEEEVKKRLKNLGYLS